MNTNSEPSSDRECFERISQAIEKRVIEIKNIQTRLRVLSIHPALSTGESGDEVTLRLVLRPAESSELLMVKNSSQEARLYDFGHTYPFSLKKDLERQVDRLVSTVREEAPRALEQSPDLNKPSANSIFYASKMIMDASLIAITVVAICGISVLALSYRDKLPDIFNIFASVILAVILLSVLRLVMVKR
jgi:hypothetical protein